MVNYDYIMLCPLFEEVANWTVISFVGCSQGIRNLKISEVTPQNSQDILPHWKTFPSIVGKQASHLQNSAKTSVDVRDRTMGMCY
jgi:hypothetical protein